MTTIPLPRPAITAFMPGDILFYRKANGVEDIAISAWTGSPFVHVAVAISAAQKIEALNNGVMRNPILNSSVAAAYRYTKQALPVNPQRLANALQWLNGQVGSMYGYGDILNALLWKFEHGVSVDVGDHYDCSALATAFLCLAGGTLVPVAQNPHVVTPAMLADMLLVKVGDGLWAS